MKAFSRILGTIVLFFVAFFLIGVFIPSVSYDIEVEINRPTSEVYQALTDSEMLPQWVSGLKSSELVRGKTGNSGAVYSMIVEDGTRSVSYEETILRFVPDSIFSYKLKSQSINGTVHIRCIEKKSATTIKISTALEGNAWFTKSLLPLIRQSIVAKNLSDFHALKSIVEKTK